MVTEWLSSTRRTGSSSSSGSNYLLYNDEPDQRFFSPLSSFSRLTSINKSARKKDDVGLHGWSNSHSAKQG